jgi:hypothetical protein
MNLLGNDNITFSGTNFPHELSTSTFEIKFTQTTQEEVVTITDEGLDTESSTSEIVDVLVEKDCMI